MFCPKDRVELEQIQMLGVDIDVCPMCSGCWLDHKELAQFTRSRGRGALQVNVQDARETEYRCPRCGEILQEGHHEFLADLFIDQCPKCRGIWLDRGELRRLLSMRT